MTPAGALVEFGGLQGHCFSLEVMCFMSCPLDASIRYPTKVYFLPWDWSEPLRDPIAIQVTWAI